MAFLLNNPDSLIAKIYKGRYYARSNLMECGKGSRPSYAWRSILFGRELLRKGLITSVGNGASTFVWSTKWIMDDIPRRPINKQRTFDANLKVSSLIQENGLWNEERLNTMFPINEVQRILQLPIGESEDREIWAHTTHGSYTVKSGYALASKAKEMEALQEGLVNQNLLELKRRIWKVPTILKIRSFLWRAASGALAVSERLNTRGMNVDTICKLCVSGVESIVHVLFFCPTAKEIWERMGFLSRLPQSSLNVTEILLDFIQLMSDTTLSVSQRQAIPWILWTIWKNMNSILYAETQISLEIQLQLACEEARLWNECQNDQVGMVTGNGVLDGSKKWEPPIAGFVKCNIHANWRNGVLHSGNAFIVRDSTGNVLHHARVAFTFSPNRLTAELRCLVWALQSMIDLGYQSVIIGSDLHDLVVSVEKNSDWPRFRVLLRRICILCSQFSAIGFESETSSSNRVAREIAKSVLRDGRFQSYLATCGPAWLHNLINTESVILRS